MEAKASSTKSTNGGESVITEIQWRQKRHEQLKNRDATSAAALISGDDSAPDYEALLIRTRVKAIGLPKFRFLLTSVRKDSW